MLKKMDKPLILIVDDVSRNIQVLGSTLRKEDYEIAVAQDGKQALKTVENILPDLILLDVMMPVMDGYEVCKRLKEDPLTKDIPIILLTGKTETGDIVKGFEVGASDYITKPYKAAELMARVKTHLELKKSKDQLEKKNEELTRLNDHKNTFLSLISHDLRNPMMAFLNLAEIMKEDYDDLDQAQIKEFISLLYEAADEMQQLLNNLLEWARLEMGKIEPKPENIDLTEIVQNSVNLSKTKALEKSIEINTRLDDQIPAYADSNMIQSVIRNILSNSIKYTNEGGQINIEATSKGSFAELTVCDNGVGIRKSKLEQLFSVKNIESTKGTKNEKGTGLGLVLCKQMIVQNDGDINIDSMENKGTTVRILLPVSKA